MSDLLDKSLAELSAALAAGEVSSRELTTAALARMTAAAARVTGANEDLETAKAFRKWKDQEQETRQAEVAMAKAGLDLAEAKRDLARVSLLREHNASSGMKYKVEELESNVEKRRKEFDGAARKGRDKAVKLDGLKAEWERLAKNVSLDFTYTEE